MSELIRCLRAVLWSFAGLGGRRADATERTEKIGILPLISMALVLAMALVAGLILLARLAAGT